jgi:preprotein translocase subunit SecF
MNKKILSVILACIVVIGLIITVTMGLNVGIDYCANKQISIYIGNEFEISDIKEIVKDVIGNEKVVIQKVELYEEIVSIKVKDITDEQIDDLIEKINEKYEIENTKDDITITNNAKLRLRDIIKPYILPIAISLVLILIYAGIKFYKINSLEVIGKLIGFNILAQLLYISILAIVRIPVNIVAVPVAITIYVATTFAVINNFENKN